MSYEILLLGSYEIIAQQLWNEIYEIITQQLWNEIYEIIALHTNLWQQTNESAGICLDFMIKVVGTTHNVVRVLELALR